VSGAAPVILVTGGAGGLGVAICNGLAQAGFRLAVGYRQSQQAAAALAAALPGGGHEAIAFDVTNSAALPQAAAALESVMGGCDALVNGAGTTRFVAHADLNGLDDALIDEILTTNIRGPFAAVRALHPLLARSRLPGGGVVVNISSIAARSGNGSNIMYCASKAALDNMTLSLARALAPQVRVLSVSPGLVDTQFVKSLDQSWRDAQVAHTPLGRLAAPEEVAAAVLAAIRDLRFSTGCVIPVDGGRPLR
jgi:3-oxoacyl-[acyl-carrier protein] reductase